MAVRLILADDHPVVLMGMRAALERHGGPSLVITEEATSVAELLSKLTTTSYDVLVTDFSMPGSNQADGLDMIGKIRRHHPRLKILVVTMLVNTELVRSILKAGANGVFDKRVPMSELAGAVQTIYHGRRYLSEELGRQFAYTASATGDDSLKLSKRELEVVRLLMSGMTGREIAMHLVRSEKTVSRQKRSAMEKLGVHNESQLAEIARRLGLT